MVEAGEKKSQEQPSAEELAQAEHYEAMMAAVAKSNDSDYDLEDDDLQQTAQGLEMVQQRKLLSAVAQQKQFQGIDFEEMEDHEAIMRQIYEENLLLKPDDQDDLSMMNSQANQLLQMQAETLAKSGIDPLQALQMLKSQQQQLAAGHPGQQMINPPSCLVGNMPPIPNNMDIGMDEQLQTQMLNGYAQSAAAVTAQDMNGAQSQVNMTNFQGVYAGQQPGMIPTQNQLGALPSVMQPETLQQKLSWIQWFSQLEGHDFFLPVDRNFLKIEFNCSFLTELNLPKARLMQCRALMNRKYAPTTEELANEQFLQLNSDTSDMYGLIHARYIRSPEGLALVYGKYLQGAYGHCPRAFCDKQRVVPNGLSDKLRQNRVKVYCPKCEEMYIPQGTNRLDGAFFGSSLAHVFFSQYAKAIVLPPKVYFYEPQLLGFRMAGKRGSAYFAPESSGITDRQAYQKQLETDMEPRKPKGKAQHAEIGAVPNANSNVSKPRNNKSRHRGKKN